MTKFLRLLLKGILKLVIAVVVTGVILLIGLIGYLTFTEYKPDDEEMLDIYTTAEEEAATEEVAYTGASSGDAGDRATASSAMTGTGSEGTSEETTYSIAAFDLVDAKNGSYMVKGGDYTIMTWNMGYGALGDNADFFLDGGSSVKTADEERVSYNMDGIRRSISKLSPDIVMLQEVDRDSDRSCNTDEMEELVDGVKADKSLGTDSLYYTFAYNYRVEYIPYPIPPIGKVDAGILMLSAFEITESTRVQLPCPFSWPVRLGNLKRCLMIDRVRIYTEEGRYTGHDLVIVNLHLEAYDDGEGKAAQTEMLIEYLNAEYEKGNYVIAGGDFNQYFSNIDTSMYPTYEGMWECGVIDEEDFGEEWQLLMDNSNPSCRSLDQAYIGADTDNFQYYLIDGFIVSDNISVESVETVNFDFAYTDHNPVVMKFKID